MKPLAYILAGLVVALQVPLWFGKGSWTRVWELDRQLVAQREENARLKARNDALDAEVRADMAASGFRVLDMTDKVGAVVERGLYYDNVHLNGLGHELYGGWIADALSPVVIADALSAGAKVP